MTSAEAVAGIYDTAKKTGLTVSNIKLSDRRNKRGYYTYIEVTYIAPGEPNEIPFSVVSCEHKKRETPEDFQKKIIETR